MSEIRLNINGCEVTGFEGQTVLEIARDNGFEIPTLCHDDRVQLYGSCGICVVESEGSPRLLRSCSTYAANGMLIRTDTARVRASRRTALELLLSDHVGDCRPPCVLACPAQTDCQGYVGLVANGQYKEALALVKDKIPLPASIGRVCPHPCEEGCRRKLVEEPIAIAGIKQFLGDYDIAAAREGDGALYTATPGAPTGKRVAVIGGGPGGLTAAYFLRVWGHAATVYDAMPEMGGMLRYGIPEYRLPKLVLQAECDAIRDMGVEFQNNVKIGKDLTLDFLRRSYDAVIVAVGAWASTGLRCPGEELDGVLGGIDFLRDIAMGNPVFTGRKIAVVGGGNTAMDACRTAIRLGAQAVYNIYRRTKNEMPAEAIEIREAEEEGVVFKNLTNPICVEGNAGKVAALRLQIMELGEPDASGRRAPVPVEGKEETIEVDTVVVAIGQKLDAVGLEELEQTKWRTISADEQTFCTNLPGVFAIGDATNKGADIAISAIGDAKKAVEMLERYLYGEELRYEAPYLVTSEKTEEDFATREKQPRAVMPHRGAAQRKGDFLEVNLGFSKEEAERESGRCLECGCHDYFECKLIAYANEYRVRPEKYEGAVHHREPQEQHPLIHRNPDKCILCGLCVRICDEVVGATALGLVDRGFNTIVKPALDVPLADTDCIACGQCVDVCPTGALTETMMIKKQVPLRETTTETACAFCSVGCHTKLTSCGDLLLRSLPTAARRCDALLCERGRFGFGEIAGRQRITAPLLAGQEVTLEEAVVYTNKKLKSLQTQYGRDSVAVAVSDRYTSEEALLVKEYAAKVLGIREIFSFGRLESGLAEVLGKDASTCTLPEMEQTELIMLIGTELMENHPVAGMKVRRAVEKGAKLALLGGQEALLDELATLRVGTQDLLCLLREITKAILDAGQGMEVPGREKLAARLADIVVGEEAGAVAALYLRAKKAVLVFEKRALCPESVEMIAYMALLSGHNGKPRDGIIQLLSGANAQGLADLGVACGARLRDAIAAGQIRGLFLFDDEVPVADLEGLSFLAVQALHKSEAALRADIVFPASSFAEISGSFTSADGTVQRLTPAVKPLFHTNSAQLSRLIAGC